MTKEQNELFTRVGPGTPMGELLRRYWHPIGAATEFDDARRTKPVRLLGEDLVLYKDLSGHYGLIGRHCPHRRADFTHGIAEECGIRCHYHGWMFGADGECLEQPYEDTVQAKRHLRKKVRAKAYPVEEKAGLLWAYMGPLPAPLVPTWDIFTWKNGFRQIVFADTPCNWLQCQENSIDPVHFEWMHENWTQRLNGDNGAYGPKHLKLKFEEFDYGLVYKRVRENTDESDPNWTVGRVALWPNGFYLGSHFEWRVPVDDENTLTVVWSFSRVPRNMEPFEQNAVPHWYADIKDKGGNWITSHVINQDIIAWVGQGVISDRTQENPGMSDRGVMMMRARFLRDLEAIKQGKDPSGLIRDPAKNEAVELPGQNRQANIEGPTLEELMSHRLTRAALMDFVFLAGQPPEIRRAFEDAMGIRGLRERVGSRGGASAITEIA